MNANTSVRFATMVSAKTLLAASHVSAQKVSVWTVLIVIVLVRVIKFSLSSYVQSLQISRSNRFTFSNSAHERLDLIYDVLLCMMLIYLFYYVIQCLLYLETWE